MVSSGFYLCLIPRVIYNETFPSIHFLYIYWKSVIFSSEKNHVAYITTRQSCLSVAVKMSPFPPSPSLIETYGELQEPETAMTQPINQSSLW